MTDLYADLGVSSNATEEEIAEAGKRRTKETHPDAGGNAEEFDRVRKALVILRDPVKRANYDATGQTEGRSETARAAAAMEIVTSKVHGILRSGADLSRTNIVDSARRQLQAEISNAKINIQDTETAIAKLEDAKKRLTLKKSDQADWLGMALEHQIREFRTGIARVQADIELRELAITMADEYDYRVEPTVQQPYHEQYNAVLDEMRRSSAAMGTSFFRRV